MEEWVGRKFCLFIYWKLLLVKGECRGKSRKGMNWNEYLHSIFILDPFLFYICWNEYKGKEWNKELDIHSQSILFITSVKMNTKEKKDRKENLSQCQNPTRSQREGIGHVQSSYSNRSQNWTAKMERENAWVFIGVSSYARGFCWQKLCCKHWRRRTVESSQCSVTLYFDFVTNM